MEDECKVYGNFEETEKGMKFNFKLKGKGCAKLTSQQIADKMNKSK